MSLDAISAGHLNTVLKVSVWLPRHRILGVLTNPYCIVLSFKTITCGSPITVKEIHIRPT